MRTSPTDQYKPYMPLVRQLRIIGPLLLLLAIVTPIQSQPIVDLLVLYTPQARDSAGGDTAILASIDQAVREVNETLFNSLIDARVRLVHTAFTPDDEGGTTSHDVDRLAKPSDGFYDEAHPLRDQVGADLVSIIIDAPTSSSVGRGNQLSSISQFLSKPLDQIAYSTILQRSLVGTYTLAHELGHNLGANHTRGDQGSPGIFEFSNAFRFSADGRTYRTVMGRQFGTKIPYFSNPMVRFLGAATGAAAEEEGPADNAETIIQTAPDIAAYRPRKVFNDAFSEAETIHGFWASATGTNIGATAEADEPNHAGSPAQHSVWWHWISPVTETIHISTEGTTFHHRLAIYERVGDAQLLPLEASDTLESPIKLNVTRGQKLSLAIDGIEGSQGFIALQLFKDNNDFSNRIRLNDSSTTTNALNYNATTEPREPAHGNASLLFGGGSNSVWWEWEAPSNGTATLTTQGTSFDTVLGVYQGLDVANLELVAEENHTGSNGAWRKVEFEAAGGERYQIAVASPGGLGRSTGMAILNLNLVRQPGVRFVEIRSDDDGSLVLTLDGFLEQPFFIEASQDLLEWTPIESSNETEFPQQITIPPSPNATSRFFRVTTTE